MSDIQAITGLGASQLKVMREKANEARKQKYLEESKKRLGRIAETKIKTSFVGAIAACEELIGFLWGNGEDALTPEQEEFKQLWEQLRNRIMTNGNNQIRAFKNELEKNTVHWDRHHIKVSASSLSDYGTAEGFTVRTPKGNEDDKATGK